METDNTAQELTASNPSVVIVEGPQSGVESSDEEDWSEDLFAGGLGNADLAGALERLTGFAGASEVPTSTWTSVSDSGSSSWESEDEGDANSGSSSCDSGSTYTSVSSSSEEDSEEAALEAKRLAEALAHLSAIQFAQQAHEEKAATRIADAKQATAANEDAIASLVAVVQSQAKRIADMERAMGLMVRRMKCMSTSFFAPTDAPLPMSHHVPASGSLHGTISKSYAESKLRWGLRRGESKFLDMYQSHAPAPAPKPSLVAQVSRGKFPTFIGRAGDVALAGKQDTPAGDTGTGGGPPPVSPMKVRATGRGGSVRRRHHRRGASKHSLAARSMGKAAKVAKRASLPPPLPRKPSRADINTASAAADASADDSSRSPVVPPALPPRKGSDAADDLPAPSPNPGHTKSDVEQQSTPASKPKRGHSLRAGRKLGMGSLKAHTTAPRKARKPSLLAQLHRRSSSNLWKQQYGSTSSDEGADSPRDTRTEQEWNEPLTWQQHGSIIIDNTGFPTLPLYVVVQVLAHVPLSSMLGYAQASRAANVVCNSGIAWVARLWMEMNIVLCPPPEHVLVPPSAAQWPLRPPSYFIMGGSWPRVYRALRQCQQLPSKPGPLLVKLLFTRLSELLLTGLVQVPTEEDAVNLAVCRGISLFAGLPPSDVRASAVLAPSWATSRMLAQVVERWRERMAEKKGVVEDTRLDFVTLLCTLPCMGATVYPCNMINNMTSYMSMKLGSKTKWKMLLRLSAFSAIIVSKRGRTIEKWHVEGIRKWAAVTETSTLTLQTAEDIVNLVTENPNTIVTDLWRRVRAYVANMQSMSPKLRSALRRDMQQCNVLTESCKSIGSAGLLLAVTQSEADAAMMEQREALQRWISSRTGNEEKWQPLNCIKCGATSPKWWENGTCTECQFSMWKHRMVLPFRAVRGHQVEAGVCHVTSHDPETVDDMKLELENSRDMIPFYDHVFGSIEHALVVGHAKQGMEEGLVAVAVETHNHNGRFPVRVLVLAVKSNYTRLVLELNPSRALKRALQTSIGGLGHRKLFVASSETCRQMVRRSWARFEESCIQRGFKVGVLHQRCGQSTESHMYNNQGMGVTEDATTRHYHEFLRWLGECVTLAKHTGFTGGLDTRGGNSTGTHSVYTSLTVSTWHGHVLSDQDAVAWRNAVLVHRLSQQRCIAAGKATLLHQAVESGSLADVERVMAMSSIDLDDRDEATWTALLLAASAGHLDICKVLIEGGAAVDLGNREGTTPLHYVARHAVVTSDEDDTALHQEVLQLLVNHGAELDARTSAGETPLHQAVSRQAVESIRWLCDRGADVNAVTEPGRNTPCHFVGFATACGAMAAKAVMLSILVEHGARVNQNNDSGETAYMLLAQHGEDHILSILQGAVDGKEAAASWKATSKARALLGSKNVVGALSPRRSSSAGTVAPDVAASGAPPRSQPVSSSRSSRRAGFFRRRKDKQETSSSTLGPGSAPVAQQRPIGNPHGSNGDSSGSSGSGTFRGSGPTPMPMPLLTLQAAPTASDRGSHRIKSPRVFFGSSSVKGRTKLHAAAECGDVNALKRQLGKKKRSALNAADSAGFTPLLLAAAGGHVGCVHVLLDSGAHVSMVTCTGFAVTHFLAHMTVEQKQVEAYSGVLRTMLHTDSSLRDACNEAGETPLHRAALSVNCTAIKILSEWEADANVRTNVSGDTCLHYGVVGGDAEAVRLLLEAGADPSVRNAAGQSALDLAESRNVPERVLTALRLYMHGGSGPLESSRAVATLQDTGKKWSRDDGVQLEVMFHVATMLPWSEDNEQQLHRKRHIGNDIVVIIFRDADATDALDLESFASQFNHVWIIVQPCAEDGKPISASDTVTHYRFTIGTRPGVPPFRPLLPSQTKGVLPVSDTTRAFLLLKCINGERAAMRSRSFRDKVHRTRHAFLKGIVQTVMEHQ